MPSPSPKQAHPLTSFLMMAAKRLLSFTKRRKRDMWFAVPKTVVDKATKFD